MKQHGWPFACAALFFLLLTLYAGADETILFQSNFEKAAVGPLSDQFLVLDGDFSVKESEGKKYLELPGAPLDTFGVMFGPTTNAGVCLSAHVFGTGKGRRYPQFAIGLDGQNGYKLKVFPAKDTLEIFKGEESLASVPFHWKTATWTVLKMRIRQTDGPAWKIEGKAWPQAEAEPKDWTIAGEEKTAPRPGRASLWGSPVSGTPIRFDALLLTSE
jgi:hypothetical protein